MPSLRANVETGSKSGAGVIPVQSPVQKRSGVEDMLQVGEAIGSLFSTNASNLRDKRKAEADAKTSAMEAQASDVTASYLKEVEQVRATKGGLAAQSFAARKYAELQGSLGAGAREVFVKNVSDSFGFNPLEESMNTLISDEEAKRKELATARETATTVLMSGVNREDPQAVEQAFLSVQNMTPEQISYVNQVKASGDMAIEQELQRNSLFQSQAKSQDVVRKQAQRTATTIFSSTVASTVAGFEVRFQQAIESKDPNVLMGLQKEALAVINSTKAEGQNAIVQSLAGQGISDASSAEISALMSPTMAQLDNLKDMLTLTDINTMTTGSNKFMFMSALTNKAGDKTPEGKVAKMLMVDLTYGTKFTENYIQKDIAKSVFDSVQFYNGKTEKPLPEAAAEAASQGAATVASTTAKDTPQRGAYADMLADMQVKGLEVGTRTGENLDILSKGIVNSFNMAARGEESVAVRKKVFEPLLNFFVKPENAKAYKESMMGSEDTFIEASMGYIQGNMLPTLAEAFGTKDLTRMFEVTVDDGRFRLTPYKPELTAPSKGKGGVDSFSAAERNRALEGNRVGIIKAARETEGLFNKVILAYSNLYDVPVKAAQEAFAGMYARKMGVNLIVDGEVKVDELAKREPTPTLSTNAKRTIGDIFGGATGDRSEVTASEQEVDAAFQNSLVDGMEKLLKQGVAQEDILAMYKTAGWATEPQIAALRDYLGGV